jgi:hypothetical protein
MKTGDKVIVAFDKRDDIVCGVLLEHTRKPKWIKIQTARGGVMEGMYHSIINADQFGENT